MSVKWYLRSKPPVTFESLMTFHFCCFVHRSPWPYANLEKGYDLVTGQQAPEKIFRLANRAVYQPVMFSLSVHQSTRPQPLPLVHKHAVPVMYCSIVHLLGVVFSQFTLQLYTLRHLPDALIQGDFHIHCFLSEFGKPEFPYYPSSFWACVHKHKTWIVIFFLFHSVFELGEFARLELWRYE